MTRPIPVGVVLSGVPFVAATALLALELVWDGWGLAHSGLIFPLAAMVLGGAIWILVFAAFAIARRNAGGRLGVSLAGVYLASVGLIAVPYETWQRASLPLVVRSSHVGELLVAAAAQGDVPTIRAAVAHGASVNARNSYGTTPLHAAAAKGQVQVVELLLERGADVNAIDGRGDSPLAAAEFSHQLTVADLLRSHGGEWITRASNPGR